MDKTLRDYLALADQTHDYLDKFCFGLTAKQIEEKVTQLQLGIKTIQSVAKRLADISNIATRVLNRKLSIANKEPNKKNNVITYPTENDHASLRVMNPEEVISITKDISIPAKVVETCAELPVNNLYYVNNIKQFAININGVIIKGNLGNLVEYQTEQSAKCEYGIDCKSFKKNLTCSYYHDPEDYIKLKQPVPAVTRNFTVGSWLYSKNKAPRTYFTRHLGSKDRLNYDLNTLKKVQYREEISNREGQLIHDLLIYMILNSQGLLERYPHWKTSI